MVPVSNLQIPIGHITSAAAIDAHRPTAMAVADPDTSDEFSSDREAGAKRDAEFGVTGHQSERLRV